MSEETADITDDVLNKTGEFLLQVDIRWAILVALVLFALIYCLKWRKTKAMKQPESVRLVLAFLQVYTGLAVVSVFILTKPPAIGLMSDFQRQTCGLIIVVFLVVGVIQEVKKFLDEKDDH